MGNDARGVLEHLGDVEAPFAGAVEHPIGGKLLKGFLVGNGAGGGGDFFRSGGSLGRGEENEHCAFSLVKVFLDDHFQDQQFTVDRLVFQGFNQGLNLSEPGVDLGDALGGGELLERLVVTFREGYGDAAALDGEAGCGGAGVDEIGCRD